MKPKFLIVLAIMVLLMAMTMLGILYFKSADYFYRDLKELNENLEVDGLKMFMHIDDAINLVGMERVEEGFGGDFYFYKTKGYYYSVSTDSDLDHYKKIGQLSIEGEKWRVFGYGKGADLENLKNELINRGYELNEELGYGKNTYKKNCVIMDVSEWEGKITKIRIIIEERKYDGRVY